MNEIKKAVALAALAYVKQGDIIGLGSGEMLDCFIDSLDNIKEKIKGAVVSNKESAQKLEKLGIDVFQANEVTSLDLYIDTADEINVLNEMVKGESSALTCGAVLGAMAKRTLILVTESQQVPLLGKFPVPVEVIPMARSYVARELFKLGGDPSYRENGITENGNVILDLHNLEILDAKALALQIKAIAGVVGVGLFTKANPDIVLVGDASGVTSITE